MARSLIAPTKSNLLRVKEQLAIAREGYELLEQKREILVMELMRMVEEVKIVEKEAARATEKAYAALRGGLLSMGRDRARRVAEGVRYDYAVSRRRVSIAGIDFPEIELRPPELAVKYAFGASTSDCDRTMIEFFALARILARLATLRTVVWRLAQEVKKTQRRVNALEKLVIPRAEEDRRFIEASLEERDRESVFILKQLKTRGGRE